jgi:hypothetical protein
MSAISPKAGSLGAIMRGFKWNVKKRIRTGGFVDEPWQPRYHDHIIRNPGELWRIRRYIAANPANWGMDRFRHPTDVEPSEADHLADLST